MWWLALGCGAVETCDTEAQAERGPIGPDPGGNVLVLVLDDVGVDKVGAYGVHPEPAQTPRLDALFAEGVRFDRAYASPSCSPTRASILTGRHPSRHGVTDWIEPWEDDVTLPLEELTFAEVAREVGRATAAVGKWHLSSFRGHTAEFDPQRQGFDHFHGILGNPDMARVRDRDERGYWHWERVDDGVLSYSDRYLTSAQADDALALVTTLPEPWVVYVGFSAAHGPVDWPPRGLAVPASGRMRDRYDAVVAALDAEIGRLLDGMGEQRARTTIVTIGDNGTPAYAVRPPWEARHAKQSLYEGGVRVPLAVAGPGVERGVSEALVHAVDVFATIAELVGVDARELGVAVDGVSLVPFFRDPGSARGRRCVLVEHGDGGGMARAVITAADKLIRPRGGPDEVLRVGVDPGAEVAVDDGAAAERLRRELRAFVRAVR